tara:strand:+ start:40 stop:294 length:255 start_codon:yes stop_codon:yes gene_type:complete
MKKFLLIIIFFSFFNHLLSDEVDCGTLDKLSTDYAKCVTEKSKKKGKLIKDKINKNLEKSGIKEKYKKFDSKKTLKDLFKKNEF